MIVARSAGGVVLPDLHLSYCTNIHAGETWDEVLANVQTHVRAVKARVSPDRPLRGRASASRRRRPMASEPSRTRSRRSKRRFSPWRSGLYVFTINGFPYGAFSGGPLKERVYRPDWLEDDRLAYSDQLADSSWRRSCRTITCRQIDSRGR